MVVGFPHAHKHDNVIGYVDTCPLFICPLVTGRVVHYEASTKATACKLTIHPPTVELLQNYLMG